MSIISLDSPSPPLSPSEILLPSLNTDDTILTNQVPSAIGNEKKNNFRNK